MNAIIEKAKGHFSCSELRKIDVPEWEQVFYVQDRITVGQRERIFSKPDGGAYSGHASMARAVMVLARDANGKPLFDEMDLHALTHQVDARVVQRIALDMLAITGNSKPDDERVEAQKNV